MSTIDHGGSSQIFSEKWRNSEYDSGPSSSPFDCGSSTENVVIDDITDNEPTSTILNNCKKQYLLPYTHIMGMFGLRPPGSSKCLTTLGHLQTIIVLLLLIIGYLMQYIFKFRRDKGYGQDGIILDFDEIFREGGFFIYIFPSILHLLGYLCAILVFKVRDSEQFHCLTEKVFILAGGKKTLLIYLWGYFFYGIIWITISSSSAFLLSSENTSVLTIQWFEISTDELKRYLKFLLILTIVCHDLVQIIVIISYCIQCCLLRNYLYCLKEKLVHHTIEPLEWMRELCEFQKFVNFLNKNLALPIGFFLILNIIYALSGSVFLIRTYSNDERFLKLTSHLCNTVSWLVLSLIPFYQAAKLNETCNLIKSSGHYIRVRPFVHHNTLIADLDSVILYASSLKISAKLFRIPIRGSYLCFIIVCVVITVLTIGMCYNE